MTKLSTFELVALATSAAGVVGGLYALYYLGTQLT